MARALLWKHANLQHCVENVAVFAFASRATRSCRRGDSCVHILAGYRLSWLAGCENFVASRSAFLRHITGCWVFGCVITGCLHTAPLSTVTGAQLQEFSARADLFVARLEFHVFVNTFAHRNRNTFAILVQNLSQRTSTALHTLQSGKRKKIQITLPLLLPLSPSPAASISQASEENAKKFN